MLPDGDLTEVGATGVNLSGGQRWRLTFARALYSRAGLLVLDKIFSAVDAHVGRHILEHGIAGDLGTGRTIILSFDYNLNNFKVSTGVNPDSTDNSLNISGKAVSRWRAAKGLRWIWPKTFINMLSLSLACHFLVTRVFLELGSPIG